VFFFFSSRRRHTRSYGDWSSDVCSSDLLQLRAADLRLFAMGFCPSAPGQPVLTPTLPAQIRCTELQAFSGSAGQLLRSASGPLRSEERRVGKGCTAGVRAAAWAALRRSG